MKLNIKDIMYKGCYYKTAENPNNREYFWYFSLEDFKPYYIEDLIENFSYKSCEDVEKSGKFIRLFRTDMDQIEDEFLTINNLKGKIFKKIAKNETDFSKAFRIFIFDYCTIELCFKWGKFEDEHLIKDAISWCKENNIPYILK